MKFRLTLTVYIRDIASSLTVDYGEYFKLTVNIYFDRGRSSEYKL